MPPSITWKSQYSRFDQPGSSGEQDPALGFRNRASEFPSSLQPLGYDHFGVGKGLLPGGAVSRTAGQLGTSAMNA